MPKRPCAIAITSDNSTILCDDIFGDVYALPLLGRAVPAIKSENEASAGETGVESQTPFTPVATTLTVHSKRNREALRQQQNTKKVKVEIREHSFDHRLILGHVSLLTNIISATTINVRGRPREYILTADRDEHIRVSRGIPQAHIIESFLLGHQEFVSQLCFLPSYPHLLLSGGGDDYLLLWDWPVGKTRQKIDLREHVESFKSKYQNISTDIGAPLHNVKNESAAKTQTEGKIAVAKIVAVAIESYSKVCVIIEG